MSRFHKDPNRNFLVFRERRDEDALIHSGASGEREIAAEWAFDCDGPEEAIEKVLGKKYALSIDRESVWDAYALSQATMIGCMPSFEVGMEKKTVYEFKSIRRS